MPIAATATLDPSGLWVRLNVSGGVAPYSWTAYPSTGTPYEVPRADTAPDGSATFDGFAPFGAAVSYQVRDSVGQFVDTPAVDVPDTLGSALADALDPTTAIVVHRVVDQLPNVWEGRSVWFDVLDRRDPFVAVAPLRLRHGPLVLRVEGNPARLALMSLLATGSPLVFRSPCHDALDDVVLLPETVTESLVSDDDKEGPRLFTIDYQAVTRDLGPYVADPSWTWADLVADPRDTSWAVLVAGFATWADVRTNVRRP